MNPSPRARTLVRGAYDLHVHVGPDLVDRRIDDVELAMRYDELGLAGFALKSHYVPTAERARVVEQTMPGIAVIGTIVLNNAVGGLNPLAVEVAAREGARIVWLPTVDSLNEARRRDQAFPPGSHAPLWVRLQRDLHERGLGMPPVRVADGAGAPLPALIAVLELVAEHRMILGTGHLSRNEIFMVVDAALECGVEEVVVTHPEFPSQDLSIDDQVALVGNGALMERCFTTPHTGKTSWEHVVEGIRATGIEHNLLSTDLGQPANPSVEDGLALFADRLLDHGLTDADVTALISNSRRLAEVAVS